MLLFVAIVSNSFFFFCRVKEKILRLITFWNAEKQSNRNNEKNDFFFFCKLVLNKNSNI